MNGTIIAGNRLVQPLALDHGPLAGLGIFIQLAGSGNVLLGNDVGSYGITAAPAEAFADGGGNVCGAQGNFHC